MKFKTKYDWQCLECGGNGACPACGCDDSCSHCNGECIDPLAVDIAAYRRDCELLDSEAKAMERERPDFPTSWEVIDDEGITIGRENEKRQALIASHMK